MHRSRTHHLASSKGRCKMLPPLQFKSCACRILSGYQKCSQTCLCEGPWTLFVGLYVGLKTVLLQSMPIGGHFFSILVAETWRLDSPFLPSTDLVGPCSFSIFSTTSLPPFPIKKYQHNDYARAKVWLLKDLNPTQDFQNCHAGDLLSGFVRITNWCAKMRFAHLGVELFPGDRKPDVCSLSRYGYRGKGAGYKARSALPAQDMVDKFCNIHLPNQKVFTPPIPYAMTW